MGRMIAVVVSLLGLLTCQALGQPDTDELNRQTVKIVVQHGGGTEVGSGVVLGQIGETLLVVTAKHVLYGREDSPHPGVPRVTVSFYRGGFEDVTAARSTFKPRRAQRDFALIHVPFRSAEPIPPAVIGRSENVPAQAVFAVGHTVLGGDDWLLQTGMVQSRGESIRHSANVGPGYSGGPLVDSTGALLGVNVRHVPGPGGFSEAVRIEDVIDTISAWVDLGKLAGSLSPDDFVGMWQTNVIGYFQIIADSGDGVSLIQQQFGPTPLTWKGNIRGRQLNAEMVPPVGSPAARSSLRVIPQADGHIMTGVFYPGPQSPRKEVPLVMFRLQPTGRIYSPDGRPLN